MSSMSNRTEKFPNHRFKHRNGYNHCTHSVACGVDHLKNRADPLDQAIPDIRERLMRIETRIEGFDKNLATKTDLSDLKVVVKADLSDLKVAVMEGINNQTKWFIGTAVMLSGVAFTAARLI